jgi:hypothetical protein
MQFMNILTNCVRTTVVIQELKIIRRGEGFSYDEKSNREKLKVHIQTIIK